MKRFTLTAVALGLLASVSFGQRAKQVASEDRVNHFDTYEVRLEQLMENHEKPNVVNAHNYYPPAIQKTGGTQAVSPIPLGFASNVFTILRGEQNQVYADPNLNMVAFVHRHDVGIWGGGGAESGKCRYDLSIDGGQTFTNDLGVINNVYQRPSRYPNITGFNPNSETDPFSTSLAYSFPTLNPSPDWDGHVTGMCDVNASAPTCTETYSLLSSQTLLQGGLTEAAPGEFWTVDFRYDGGATTGELFLNKGTYNGTNDIIWAREDTITPNHFTAANGGTAVLIGPNMAFSPVDPMTGYVAFLGDLVGGQDTSISPIFIKTTDGGDTWGAPMEVDMRTLTGVVDSLQTLWIVVDTITGDTVPASSGTPTLAFDYDMTVDGNGNPHLTAVLGTTGAGQAYSIGSGLAKFLVDIWSPDGGASWNINYVSPVLTFRGTFGAQNPQTMDNQPQISRTANGDHIFYSWADSDTAAATGNMNGIGFGVSDNLAPNLRIAGMRVSDNFRTCVKLVTDEDFVWEGAALWPTMAPTVFVDASGMVSLPIVCAQLVNNDPLAQTQFHYFGGDATFDATADFNDPLNQVLTWDNILSGCAFVDVENPVLEDGITLGQSYPNPTTSEAAIDFHMPFTANVTMDLVNVYGQQVAVITDGEYAAGKHRVNVNTSDLATGVYFYNLRTNGKVITKKMIVTK